MGVVCCRLHGLDISSFLVLDIKKYTLYKRKQFQNQFENKP